MTVIDTVQCPVCGDTHQVVCEHDGKECEYCGRPFRSEEACAEHEDNCEWKNK